MALLLGANWFENLANALCDHGLWHILQRIAPILHTDTCDCTLGGILCGCKWHQLTSAKFSTGQHKWAAMRYMLPVWQRIHSLHRS